MTRRVLITGGAGFIGHHLARRMLSEGWAVTVIDNESTGRREDVPTECRYVKGDVRAQDDLREAFADGPDAVFHIAGQASNIKSFDRPQLDLEVNVVGTINVVEMCLLRRVPKLVYAGSMTAYGPMATLPVAEDAPLAPISYYGIGKMAAERFVLATAMRRDLATPFDATVFRMFNVYGPGQSLTNPYQGVLAIFIGHVLRGEPCVIHADGAQSRDFVYIDDVTRAWASAALPGAASGEVLNLGSGQGIAVRDLVTHVCRALGLDADAYPRVFEPRRPGDQDHTRADIRKAAEILGWKPRIGFEEGLRRTIEWARGVGEPVA